VLSRYLGWARWLALAAAVVALIVFLVAQRQTIKVSYAGSPATAAIPEGSAGELSGATVPSVEQMTAMVTADPVVRLPGSVAHWDDARVRAAIGTDPTRILVAPPGLSKADQDKVRAVGNATIRVIGTEVTGGVYRVSGNQAADWQPQFAAGDVTAQLLTLIAGLADKPAPDEAGPPPRREPTAAETAKVAASARRITGSAAFPGSSVLVVTLPQQPVGPPMPRYGPALAALDPGTPVVVMYGDWIEYDGPQAADFADVATASFYGQFGDRLSSYAYPQQTVLDAYLARVTDVRYAGLFDRPLPYQPFDPLRVTLPALPWVFAVCVLIFLALSVRPVRRPPRIARAGTPARLAALSSLAVEMSLLTDRAGDAALTRGFTLLTAARDALAKNLPDAHVRDLLATAESELDDAARKLPFPGFRPADYLK
jgi:hypothetical protein